MRVFALNASNAFGHAIAASMERPLDEHEEREFDDGEHKTRPLVSVRNQDCYVVQSLHAGPDAPASEKLIRLLFFTGALRQSGAARVTAVIPYLAYGRKDRRTKPRDPVTTRYLAQIMEAAGIDRVLTLETHNVVALENAFRIPTEHLTPHALFCNAAGDFAGDAPLIVASPDPGGVKRAQLFREMLERRLKRDVGSAYLEKRRSEGEVSGSHVAGDVAGTHAIIIDDVIASGTTMAHAAESLKSRGVGQVAAFAAHGLFTGGGRKLFDCRAIDQILVTDSVPAFRLGEADGLRAKAVSVAPLFGWAIATLAENRSLTTGVMA